MERDFYISIIAFTRFVVVLRAKLESSNERHKNAILQVPNVAMVFIRALETHIQMLHVLHPKNLEKSEAIVKSIFKCMLTIAKTFPTTLRRLIQKVVKLAIGFLITSLNNHNLNRVILKCSLLGSGQLPCYFTSMPPSSQGAV